MKNELNKPVHEQIPERLRRYRGGRAFLTFFVGVIVLCSGVYLFVRSFYIDHYYYEGEPDQIYYSRYECNEEARFGCLTIKFEDMLILHQLSESQKDNYLSLVVFSDSLLNSQLAKPENSFLETEVQRKEEQRRLKLIEHEIEDVSLVHNGRVLVELIINDTKIIRYWSPFWIGFAVMIVGAGWTYGHVMFFVKDPYRVYKDKH